MNPSFSHAQIIVPLNEANQAHMKEIVSHAETTIEILTKIWDSTVLLLIRSMEMGDLLQSNLCVISQLQI